MVGMILSGHVIDQQNLWFSASYASMVGQILCGHVIDQQKSWLYVLYLKSLVSFHVIIQSISEKNLDNEKFKMTNQFEPTTQPIICEKIGA